MAEIGRSTLAALVRAVVARAGFVHPADRCTALVEATLWALVAIRTVNKSGWCNARCKPDEQQRRLDGGRSGDARSGPELGPSDFGFSDDRFTRLYTVFQVDSAWSQSPSQACWAILPDDPP